jgi:hypothetical protein
MKTHLEETVARFYREFRPQIVFLYKNSPHLPQSCAWAVSRSGPTPASSTPRCFRPKQGHANPRSTTRWP